MLLEEGPPFASAVAGAALIISSSSSSGSGGRERPSWPSSGLTVEFEFRSRSFPLARRRRRRRCAACPLAWSLARLSIHSFIHACKSSLRANTRHSARASSVSIWGQPFASGLLGRRAFLIRAPALSLI